MFSLPSYCQVFLQLVLHLSRQGFGGGEAEGDPEYSFSCSSQVVKRHRELQNTPAATFNSFPPTGLRAARLRQKDVGYEEKGHMWVK